MQLKPINTMAIPNSNDTPSHCLTLIAYRAAVFI